MSANRMLSCGASEIAALFGCSPWQSEYGLWCLKTGLTQPRERTERMRIGLMLEKAIFDAWAAAQDGEIDGDEWLHNTKTLVHRDHPFITATPDAVLTRVAPATAGTQWSLDCMAVADVKTVDPSPRKDWNGGAPEYYQLQLQQQMLVTGATRSVLIAAFGFNEISHQWIDADPKTQEQIIERTTTFWKRVQGELPPPEVDGHDATSDALKGRRVEEKTIVLAEDVREWADYLSILEKNNKSNEARARELKNKIRASLGDASRGVFADGTGFRIQTIDRKESIVKASSYSKLIRITSSEAEDGEE